MDIQKRVYYSGEVAVGRNLVVSLSELGLTITTRMGERPTIATREDCVATIKALNQLKKYLR